MYTTHDTLNRPSHQRLGHYPTLLLSYFTTNCIQIPALTTILAVANQTRVEQVMYVHLTLERTFILQKKNTWT